jgi:D-3-phosphoglycerate dehydrogenase
MATVLVTHPHSRLPTYFGDRALSELRGVAQVRLNPTDQDWQGADLVAAAQGCDIIIAYRQTPFDAAVFAALPQLWAVCRCAMDIRTIDVAAASQQGILITRASAGFGTAVTEWVMGVMIDAVRHISASRIHYQAGQEAPALMGRELRGATVGVVGHGHIGRQVCALAQAFGMQVLAHDPHVQAADPGVSLVSWERLLSASDHVVCLAPATAETENLFNANAFAQMKPGAWFINAARGNLVDEGALRHALDHGPLAGAALDVGRGPDQTPSLDLAQHPRVIATPHIGGLTPPATEHQALETVAQTRALLQGHIPPGAVNAEHASRWRAATPSMQP